MHEARPLQQYAEDLLRTTPDRFRERYPHPILLHKSDDREPIDDGAMVTRPLRRNSDFASPLPLYRTMLVLPLVGRLAPSPSHLERPASGERVITVGRSRDADITLTYPGISKEHARFRLRPGADEPIVTLEDAGSRNGTFVDDGPLPSDQPIRLSDRSRIRFAGYLFRFHTAEGFAEVVELLARRDSMPSPAG